MIWIKPKHVSTANCFTVWKVQAQKVKVSWKVLAPYYFITGIGLKSKRARISTPCRNLRELSWLPCILAHGSDIKAWQPWGTWGQTPATLASVTSTLLSLALLAWMRGGPACPLSQNNKWISPRSCWEWREESTVSTSAWEAQSDLQRHDGNAERWGTDGLGAARGSSDLPRGFWELGPGRVKKSALKELGVPNKGWPFHLSPMLQIAPVVGMKYTFECSV